MPPSTSSSSRSLSRGDYRTLALAALGGALEFYDFVAADGAPGGWGFVIRRSGQPSLESYGSVKGTLAKVMEYRAVAEALCTLAMAARSQRQRWQRASRRARGPGRPRGKGRACRA